MKLYIQLLFTLMFLLLLSDLSGQATISEDFESYGNGDLITIISPTWKLWPRGTDAHVTTEKSASGENALKVEGGSNTDLYFPFNRKFTAGSIQFSMDLFIPKGSNGYFSFQGEERPGLVWSMQCYLDSNGFFRIVDDNLTNLQNVYPQDQWFNMSVDINLESHLWRFYVDGECVGSYIQKVAAKQSVASLALYAEGEKALFYVDNISFIHKGLAAVSRFDNDAAIAGVLDANPELPRTTLNSFVGINGTEQSLYYMIKNMGRQDIKTFELGLEIDGENTTQEFKVNLPEGADTTVSLDKKLIYNGNKTYRIALSKINGLADDNVCNNSLPINIQGYNLHPDKKVWVEEATGTWCQFCPRGEVYMNYLAKKYPDHFVGIAVHSNDPMECLPWIGNHASRKKKEDNKAKGLMKYIQGFPSALVDRSAAMDPTKLEIAFIESASKEPLATLSHNAKWNAQSRELEVIITTNVKDTLPDDIRLIVGLTEDKVTGRGRRWGQVNVYSSGVQGTMGGYEKLPYMVPDSLMVYNHVAKLLLTPFEGDSLKKDAFQPEDSTIVRTFTQIIPGDWNLENMHIVSAISIGSSDIDNANKSTISEAVSNGKNRK